MARERHSRRAMLRRTGAIVGVLGTAGCLGDDASPRVRMDDLTFSPSLLETAVGSTVRWENTSEIPHTVTAYEARIPDGAVYFASGGFDSERAARDDVKRGLVAPGETYERAFERSGRYDYFCLPHEGAGMVGTVRVRYRSV